MAATSRPPAPVSGVNVTHDVVLEIPNNGSVVNAYFTDTKSVIIAVYKLYNCTKGCPFNVTGEPTFDVASEEELLNNRGFACRISPVLLQSRFPVVSEGAAFIFCHHVNLPSMSPVKRSF
ncbi:uncharacterized protein ACB058_002301 [Synchiropus picturatus]